MRGRHFFPLRLVYLARDAALSTYVYTRRMRRYVLLSKGPKISDNTPNIQYILAVVLGMDCERHAPIEK